MAVLSVVGPIVVTCRSLYEPMTLRLEQQLCTCTLAVLPSLTNVSVTLTQILRTLKVQVLCYFLLL